MCKRLFYDSSQFRVHIRESHSMSSEQYAIAYGSLETRAIFHRCRICHEDVKQEIAEITRHLCERHGMSTCKYGARFKMKRCLVPEGNNTPSEQPRRGLGQSSSKRRQSSRGIDQLSPKIDQPSPLSKQRKRRIRPGKTTVINFSSCDQPSRRLDQSKSELDSSSCEGDEPSRTLDHPDGKAIPVKTTVVNFSEFLKREDIPLAGHLPPVAKKAKTTPMRFCQERPEPRDEQQLNEDVSFDNARARDQVAESRVPTGEKVKPSSIKVSLFECQLCEETYLNLETVVKK